jgi:hypothetical protein
MPRKSASSLSVVPLVPGQGRPEPPPDLDPLEQKVWGDVVAALPGHWIDLAAQVVLRRLVAQAAIAERQEMRLRQLRAQDADNTEEAAELTIAHGAVAKTVAQLLAQLRATPRSRMVSRAAGQRFDQASESRPWEIKAPCPGAGKNN